MPFSLSMSNPVNERSTLRPFLCTRRMLCALSPFVLAVWSVSERLWPSFILESAGFRRNETSPPSFVKNAAVPHWLW